MKWFESQPKSMSMPLEVFCMVFSMKVLLVE